MIALSVRFPMTLGIPIPRCSFLDNCRACLMEEDHCAEFFNRLPERIKAAVIQRDSVDMVTDGYPFETHLRHGVLHHVDCLSNILKRHCG